MKNKSQVAKKKIPSGVRSSGAKEPVKVISQLIQLVSPVADELPKSFSKVGTSSKMLE